MLRGAGQHAQVTLPLREGGDLCDEFDELPDAARLLVCKLAFCVAFREPVLLSGPSGFKSHCVHLLGRSLLLDHAAEGGVHTIFLSPLTEAADLEGSIEPHTLESFSAYLQPCVRWLEEQRATASSSAQRAGAPPPPPLEHDATGRHARDSHTCPLAFLASSPSRHAATSE